MDTLNNLPLLTFLAFFQMFVISLVSVGSSWFAGEAAAGNQFDQGFSEGFHGSAVASAIVNGLLFTLIAAVRRTKWTFVGAGILLVLAAIRTQFFIGMYPTWDDAKGPLLQALLNKSLLSVICWSQYVLTAVVVVQTWRSGPETHFPASKVT